jgi:hypothetical protein
MLISKKLLLSLFSFYMLLVCASAQDTVAYYPFSGNGLDASDYNNDALIHGAFLAQDRFGMANNAFAFDGQQSYLEAENAPHLQTDLATVSFWVNVTEIPAQGEAYLLTLGSWQERWKISLPSHGKLIWTTNANIISDMDAGDGNELQEGVWTHVAMVHDGVKDLIYIDGVLANEKDVTGNLDTTTSPFGMGYNSYEGGSYFNGLLDEVLIFDDALSAQQIADLYTSQSTPSDIDEGMVACYSFSNNLFDETAFANHGVGTDLQSTTDRFGFGSSAYQFNGTSSQIDIDNSVQLNSDYTTVSFWIKV